VQLTVICGSLLKKSLPPRRYLALLLETRALWAARQAGQKKKKPFRFVNLHDYQPMPRPYKCGIALNDTDQTENLQREYSLWKQTYILNAPGLALAKRSCFLVKRRPVRSRQPPSVMTPLHLSFEFYRRSQRELL
jgi:hypothetical protein